MLTWLLSLAVAAAASPPLNVTLTNNLLGITTVRVNGAGLRVEATLGAAVAGTSPGILMMILPVVMMMTTRKPGSCFSSGLFYWSY